jgi:hypothetical protein
MVGRVAAMNLGLNPVIFGCLSSTVAKLPKTFWLSGEGANSRRQNPAGGE